MHKLAFVTGASSGIGRDLAILLAQRGYELVLLGRNIEQLQALQKALKPMTLVAVYALDLRREFDVDKLVSLIYALMPTLVINCAGIGFYGEITDGPLKEQLDIIQVNVTAATAATIAACNALKAHKKEGVICNVSSAIAFIAAPRMSVYAASKAFINSFSLAADAEMKEYGIRVLVSCPGQVKTAFRQRAARGKSTVGGNGFLNMQPLFVAREILHQIDAKKPLKIIDFKTRFMTFLAQLMPRCLIHKIFLSEIKKREGPQ